MFLFKMFPAFTIFLFFLLWFTFAKMRMEKRDKARREEFWEKEEAANATRRKDISLLPYIQIPLEQLPFGIRPEDTVLQKCEACIRTLSDQKILNLTGMTNTEVKAKYGAPNLPFLSECDHNFTDLVRTMQQWGTRLLELGLAQEAECVLFYAIRWGSDIKGSYLLLARLYQEKGDTASLAKLKEYAGLLHSLMKQPIPDALEEFH